MYAEKHAFRRFQDDLKNGRLASVVLLCGKEQYLVKWALDTIINKFISPATRAMDLSSIDADDIQQPFGDAVIAASETLPMFSAKRVVAAGNYKGLVSDDVRHVKDESMNRLTDYISKVPESVILVFTGILSDGKKTLPKAVAKFGAIYDFGPLGRSELKSFAAKRFKAAGTDISDRCMDMLLDETGYFNRESDYDLYSFDADITKLIAMSEDRTVKPGDVETAVLGDANTFVFDLLDSISGNDKEKSFRMLHDILTSGTAAFSLIGLIAGQFELLLSVSQMCADGVRPSEMARKAGANEYRIKKLLPYVRLFSISDIRRILKCAYDCDRNIKTGLLKEQTALELFIASV